MLPSDVEAPSDMPEPKAAGTPDDHEKRLAALEAWAKAAPGTTFQPPPPMTHGGKVVAYYKAPPESTVWKYHMDQIDFQAAMKANPDLWTLDAPKEGVMVIDKTMTPGLPSTVAPDMHDHPQGLAHPDAHVEDKPHVLVPPGSTRADGQAPTTSAPIAPAPIIVEPPPQDKK